ncbi:MAG TPA: hypothetical protein VHZ31_00445 [Solirubrobacteraceae bacterium]|jgi:hypothetical protein|nr:hypothetical protein [Solirubrobacteraceae bacterium]
MTQLRRPTGAPPPQTATLVDGRVVKLGPLAELVAERYGEHYPDEAERYGPEGREWCVHDNLHLLAWAFGAHDGAVVFEEQVLWLARVLASRDYPLDRLAHDLRIAADVVVGERVPEADGVAAILLDGAAAVQASLPGGSRGDPAAPARPARSAHDAG